MNYQKVLMGIFLFFMTFFSFAFESEAKEMQEELFPEGICFNPSLLSISLEDFPSEVVSGSDVPFSLTLKNTGKQPFVGGVILMKIFFEKDGVED